MFNICSNNCNTCPTQLQHISEYAQRIVNTCSTHLPNHCQTISDPFSNHAQTSSSTVPIHSNTFPSQFQNSVNTIPVSVVCLQMQIHVWFKPIISRRVTPTRVSQHPPLLVSGKAVLQLNAPSVRATVTISWFRGRVPRNNFSMNLSMMFIADDGAVRGS